MRRWRLTVATVVVAGTTTTPAAGTPAGCCSARPAVSAARSASSRSASRHRVAGSDHLTRPAAISTFRGSASSCTATWSCGSCCFQRADHKPAAHLWVALPEFVIDGLAAHCRGKGRDDLVWPSPRGRYISGPRWKTSWLATAVARYQAVDDSFPRVTPHGLRHTAASLAIHAGANPKVVQRMLGHASAAMTLDVYADVFDSDLESVAESVAKMLPREPEAASTTHLKSPLPAKTVETPA